MITINDRELCSGCGACNAVCPQKCIRMEADEEGFYYPVVMKEKCIHCGLCENTCPYNTVFIKNEVINAYAALNTDQTIRMNSSSGGVFTALSNYVLHSGGVVYGVSFSDDLRNVQFCQIEKEENLYQLRGSKYIQALPNNLYKNIQSQLQDGRRVLFSGTPCQINALNNYLHKNYENLLCVDIICHGVPSGKLWNKYLDFVEQKKRNTVKTINFRSKKNGWHDFGMQKNMSDGREVFISKDRDPFLQMFLKNYSLRPSCYNCHAKSEKSADISLGDFWGIRGVYPELDDDRGTSLVLSRTLKGDTIINSLSEIELRKVDVKTALRSNTAEYMSVKKPSKRDNFYIDLDTLTFREMITKYGKADYKAIVKKIVAKSAVWRLYKQFRKG